MNIVTGYRGEAHITSQQDQAKNQGIFGSGSYILDVGQKLHAEAVSANEVRIYDGVLSHQGVVAVVEKNTYDSVTITSGSQGADRCDLIVARYTKEASTGVESMTFEVIMGTEGETTPPAYNTGDIQAGDSPVDMPIYEVHLSGIQIESLVPVASQIGNVNGAFTMNDILPSGDVNAATTPGAYELVSTNTYTNLPTGITSGVLTVSKAREGGFIIQLLTGNHPGIGNILYLRAVQEAAWTSWMRLVPEVITETHTYNGLTITARRAGKTAWLTIRGRNTEAFAPGDAYSDLCTLSREFLPAGDFNSREWASLARVSQINIGTNGLVRIGYSNYPNSSGTATPSPIPASSNIRVEVTYIPASMLY